MRKIKHLPPETADEYKGLRFVTGTAQGRNGPLLSLSVWRPRGQSPTTRYFKEQQTLDTYLMSVLRCRDRELERKAERKDAREKSRSEFADKVKVGSIFYTSWGYEQTNREFFEVVEKKGGTVVLRELQQRKLEDTGPFSANVTYCPGEYLDKPPIRKRLGPGCISFASYRHGWLVKAQNSWHCSWGH